MRQTLRIGLAAAILAAFAVSAAQAQYEYDDAPPPRRGGYYEEGPYRAPPPRRGYDSEGGYRSAPRPVGLNCDAVQQGLTGPKPYSCPLPGPRPLGARCFCDMPVVSFRPPQTAVGRVVP